MVVTPTLKAAEVAAAETGADGRSASWLIHQHGWRWDADGHWTRRPDPAPDGTAQLRSGDLLLVCAEGTQATRAEVEQLLGLVAEVAATGGDGAVLVRRVAALLAADIDGNFPDTAACGPIAE